MIVIVIIIVNIVIIIIIIKIAIIFASLYNHQLVSIDSNSAAQINYELGEESYRSKLNSLDSATFLDLMSMDKKVADGQLSLVLLEGNRVGKVRIKHSRI